MQALKGHKQLVSGLAFRVGGGELYSASYDRSVKLWSVPEFNYMDSLFGHQSEVTAVDAQRQERALTAGFDRSCRVWKIPEESQLIFRASGLATDCVKCAPHACHTCTLHMHGPHACCGGADGAGDRFAGMSMRKLLLACGITMGTYGSHNHTHCWEMCCVIAQAASITPATTPPRAGDSGVCV